TLYGDLLRASGKNSDSEIAHGLALSYVILALHDQLKNGEQTVPLAREAEEVLLKNIGREPMLGRTQLVTLALSRSLQAQPEEAFQTLKDAIVRGENTVNRFERHRALGFRAIAENPEFGPQFDEQCKVLRATLKFE